MMNDTKEELKKYCEHTAEWYEKMAAGLRYCPTCCRLLETDHCDTCDEDTQDLYEYLADNVYDVRITTDLHHTLYGCRLMVAGGGPKSTSTRTRKLSAGIGVPIPARSRSAADAWMPSTASSRSGQYD